MTTPTTTPASGADSSAANDGDVPIAPDSTGQKVDATVVTRDDGTGNGTNESVIRQRLVIAGDNNLDLAEVTASKPRRDATALTTRGVETPLMVEELRGVRRELEMARLRHYEGDLEDGHDDHSDGGM